MNCERVQNSFCDLDAGSLSAAEAAEVREHLNTCPACQREWADFRDTLHKLAALPAPLPGSRVRQQFYAMLETHLQRSGSAHPFRGSSGGHLQGRFRSPSLWWQGAAAAALLAVGIGVGVYGTSASRRQLKSAVQQLASTQQELSALRAKVDSVDQLVSYSLAQQQPAQARLQQVVATLQDRSGSEQELASLLSALAFDSSTNVRLSALEALYLHADQKSVRRGVLAALPRESSPLVQVAMIDFLASLRDREAAPALEELSRRPNLDAAVRTAAQRALAQI